MYFCCVCCVYTVVLSSFLEANEVDVDQNINGGEPFFAAFVSLGVINIT